MSNKDVSFRVIKTLDGESRLQIENPNTAKRFATIALKGGTLDVGELAGALTLALRGMEIAGIERRVGFRFEYEGRTYEVRSFTEQSEESSGLYRRPFRTVPPSITLIDVTPEDPDDD